MQLSLTGMRVDEQAAQSRRLATPVLSGDLDTGAELGGGMPGPMRVVEYSAPDRHHVRLAGGDDELGLLRLGDQADGDDRNAHRLADLLGELDLVAGSQKDILLRRQTARRDVT